ncbi:MAG TPA: thioesterase II family protein [Pyrinomonadaceae bacterium]|jgi:medium-chain acyl-[acyl-carrier-protein] hydrolase
MTRPHSTGSTSTQLWLVHRKPNPQVRLRLFCFPYSGGSALIFRDWAENLPDSVEVCPVQLPGRGLRTREAAFTSLPPLVQAVDRALLPYMDKPFAFFGHSMGAAISFELARQQRRAHGMLPLQLFVSARRAPQVPALRAPAYNLPDREFIEELRRLNGMAEMLEQPELMKFLLPIIRADFSVAQTYVFTPEPPLSCPISAFGGTHDEDVSGAHLEAWREQTSSDFSLCMVPGDHFFINTHKALLLGVLHRQLLRLVESLA